MTQLNIIQDCKNIMKIIFGLTSVNQSYKYNINDQLIRSGLSIGSNISEGNCRKGKDRKHFFDIALGSLEECRFQLQVYPNYNYTKEVDDKFDKIRNTVLKLKSLS